MTSTDVKPPAASPEHDETDPSQERMADRDFEAILGRICHWRVIELGFRSDLGFYSTYTRLILDIRKQENDEDHDLEAALSRLEKQTGEQNEAAYNMVVRDLRSHGSTDAIAWHQLEEEKLLAQQKEEGA